MLGFTLNRNYTRVKLTDEMRAAKVTQKELDMLNKLAHHVFVEVFGLVPKWDVHIQLFEEDEYEHTHGVNPHSTAFANWPDHYHTGVVGIKAPILKEGSDEVLSVLIHEAIHLTMASLTDLLNEATPKRLYSDVNNADEEFVSEMTSIFYQQLRLSGIDKLLA